MIKDVPKTLVYRLVDHRNDGVVPQSIIDRPPSAELRPDQKDSDSLPAYETLDAILEAYVEEDADREQLLLAGFDEEVVDRVIALVERAEYKRRQQPPGVKITPRAFGRDRRMPITNAYRLRGAQSKSVVTRTSAHSRPLVVGDVDLPHRGGATAVPAAGVRVDRAAGDRAQEARLVGDRAAAAGGDRVGDHGVDAAVHEPQRLADGVGHGHARGDGVVGLRGDLEVDQPGHAKRDHSGASALG